MKKVYSLCPYIFPFLLLASLFSIDLYAGTTGKLTGKVTDATTNEPLIGTNIIVVGTNMGAAADVDGNYFILNIPPGTYQIKATQIGYASTTIQNVKISVDQTTRIDIKLGTQVIQLQNVVVTSQRGYVQKDLTSTEEKISGEQIKNMPVEDVQSVVNLQAGVVDGHFRGGRIGEVKYLVDGVSVNDVYSGSSTLEADVSSIQELQVLTGTFNAEYGEALSGVVNQVTKIGGEKYTGSLSLYSGDYFTQRSNLYPDVNKVRPKNVYNFQGNISGPVPETGDFLKFFLSGRYLNDDGYIYGKRQFNPSDSSNFTNNDPSKWYVGATGNNAYVPMNSSKKVTLQGKLELMVGSGRGIVFNGLYQNNDYQQFGADNNNLFVLDPDGAYNYFQRSFLGSASYTQLFSSKSFLDFLGSAFLSDYKQYVYSDPLDPRYVNPQRLADVSGASFYTGGTQNWHFLHKTNTYTGKIDFTSQITDVHEIKTGIEYDYHSLNYQDFQTIIDATTGFKPALPAPGSFNYNIYNNHPYQLAAYFQDKIELDYLIVNVGIRYDYFQPDANVLSDPSNIAELNNLTPPFPGTYFYKASAKSQVSPRLGISYPITDKGAVHISYGHFFQIPPFDYLYRNPNFRIPLTGDVNPNNQNTIGNADLKPQQTVMYEIGLQQEIFTDFGINVTTYYKDIRNLLGVELFLEDNFKQYAKYINTDYGSVTGFTVSFQKKFSDGYSANLDYTYQVAKGDASDPNDAFLKAQATPPVQPNKQLVPLDWDRRHSLNFTATAGELESYLITMVAQLGSGLPYTPSLQQTNTGIQNSSNKPAFFNIDLYLTKYLKLMGLNFSVFAKIYNLFDTPNEQNVYTDTGRAGYTLQLTQQQSIPRGVNTLAQFYTRPDFYSAPRQVLVGAQIDF
ncbi:MAG: TonB-dependent receptor [Ignavibacteriaceae bacterium]|nr:TonB-dependent receptor [Ignavibacteriaceae bacterium]